MELKPMDDVEMMALITAFNRTNMELKRGFHRLPLTLTIPFNRTNMELKRCNKCK